MLTFGQIFHITDTLIDNSKKTEPALPHDARHAVMTWVFKTNADLQMFKNIQSSLAYDSAEVDGQLHQALFVDTKDKSDASLFIALEKWLTNLIKPPAIFDAEFAPAMIPEKIRLIQLLSEAKIKLFKQLVIDNPDAIQVKALVLPDAKNSENTKLQYFIADNGKRYNSKYFEEQLRAGNPQAEQFQFDPQSWHSFAEQFQLPKAS